MKTKILILWLFICGAIMPLYSQTYSEADINELKLIAKRTDYTGALNWLSEPDPGKWKGVTWGRKDGKVWKLELDNCNLTGDLYLTKLDELDYVCCNNNQLQNITTPKSEEFSVLECRNNNLGAQGLILWQSKNLMELYCTGNEWLSWLDLSENIRLSYLDCSDCRNLYNIDFPHTASLYGDVYSPIIICKNTNVQTIDLTHTYTGGLQLDVSDNKYLSAIYFNGERYTGSTATSYLDCRRCPNLTYIDFSRCRLNVFAEGTPLSFLSLATAQSGQKALLRYSKEPVTYPGKTINSIGDTCLSFRTEANAIPKNPSVFKVVKDNVEYFGKADDGNICTFGAGEYYAEITNSVFPGYVIRTPKIIVTDPILSITPEDINLSNLGDSVSIEVTSNTKWKVSKKLDTENLWLKLSAGSGANNGTISIIAEPNYEYTARYDTIVFSCKGLEKKIAIIQNPTIQPAAIFSVNKTNLDFGLVDIGISKKDSILIKNTGNCELQLKYRVEENTNFSIATDTAIVVASDSLWLGVTFIPADTAMQSGKIIINHNAGSLPDTIYLSGKGVDIVAVEELEQAPTEFVLSQNYPNPFNPSTMINYQLPMNSNVSLKIFDILGREVTTLVNEQKPAGNYTVEWNGTNTAGQQVGSGIYFYQLKTGSGFMETKKMMLLR